MKPGKHSGSDTRITPLLLANGHGNYDTAHNPYIRTGNVVHWRWGMAVTCSVTYITAIIITFKPFQFWNGYATSISLLRPPCDGFRMETATWIQK